MSARPAEADGGGEGIFAVAAAGAVAGHPHDQLAAGDQGGARRGLQGELGMGAAERARLAITFAEQYRPDSRAWPLHPPPRRSHRPARAMIRYSEASALGVSDQPAAGQAMPYRASTALASATVVGSATVGPEPISSGRSPATSEMARVSRRAGAAARARRPPLIRDRWRRTLLISPIDAPRAEQGLGDLPLFRQVQPVARQAGQGGRAAAEQYEDQIILARFPCQGEQPPRGLDAAFVRNRMAGVDQFDAIEPARRAVRHDGEAGQPPRQARPRRRAPSPRRPCRWRARSSVRPAAPAGAAAAPARAGTPRRRRGKCVRARPSSGLSVGLAPV